MTISMYSYAWRMLMERESLWFRVLSARYGTEEGRLRCGREASLWWRDVHALCREEWFSQNVSRVIGSGNDTLFWSDVWMAEVSIRDRFPRLFDLSLFQDLSVFDMCQLGWGWGVRLGRGGGGFLRGKRRG